MNKQNSFTACKSLVELMRELKRLALLFPVPGGHYQKFVQAKQDFLDDYGEHESFAKPTATKKIKVFP